MATAGQASQLDANQTTEVPQPKPPVSQRHIFGLLSYYVGLAVAAGALIEFLLFHELAVNPPPPQSLHLARMLAFIMCGAIIGSVLYQIRELYRHYLKEEDYDPRWLGKYISGPWEAALLAALVYSLIRSETAAVTGSHGGENSSTLDDFGLFGLGGLIGFGMREVVGWLAGIVAHVFPTKVVQSDNGSKKNAHNPAS